MKKCYKDFLIVLFIFTIAHSSLFCETGFIKSSSNNDEELVIMNTLQTNLLENRERDWSYQAQSPVLSSLKIADLDGDGIEDIIMTTYGHQPNPYGAGFVYAIDIDGNDLPGWPIEVGSPFSATAAIGDINNDGIIDIVVGSWSTLYAWDAFGNLHPGFPLYYGGHKSPVLLNVDDDEELEIIYPSGSSLYIFNHDGSVLPGWPVSTTYDIGSPAIADIDNDGEYELVAGTFQGPVVPESFDLFAWNMDGSIVGGFPFEACGVIKTAPAIGDLDNDGTLEIVTVAYEETDEDLLYVIDPQGNLMPGWPVAVTYGRLSSPALGDIDGDDDLEILIGGYVPSPTFLEKLYAFHHDGNTVANWPVILQHEGSAGNINSSPIIADIDGDTTSVEIIVKVHNYIFALHSDGSVVESYPYYLDDEGSSGTFSPTPALGDMDNDGDIELVFTSHFGNLVFLDQEDLFFPDFAFWPMFKNNRFNTGSFQAELGTVEGIVQNINTSEPVAEAIITVGEIETETNVDGEYSIDLVPGDYTLTCLHDDYEPFTYPEDVIVVSDEITVIDIFMNPLTGVNDLSLANIELFGNYPNPFNPSTEIRFQISDISEIESAEITIYNLKGQKVKQLISGQLSAGQHSVDWNGKDENNKPVSSGVYFYKLIINGTPIAEKKCILLK